VKNLEFTPDTRHALMHDVVMCTCYSAKTELGFCPQANALMKNLEFTHDTKLALMHDVAVCTCCSAKRVGNTIME